MSALSALAEYSSDSDSSHDIAENLEQLTPYKRARLPPPRLVLDSEGACEERPRDDPCEHGGRVRSFPHQRGNWATFVYVPCCDTELVDKFVEEAQRRCTLLRQLERCSEPHVSLSRTTVLRYHWINTFTATLREFFRELECDVLELSTVKVYCNEEETRSFVALEVDRCSSQQLKKITDKVDTALKEFKLPEYYEEPSFHVSVLWCTGNKLQELRPLVQQLQEILVECGQGPFRIVYDKIICKCGNKFFHYPLQY